MKNLLIYLLIYGCMFSLQTPVQAQNSQQLFQKGIIQEEGEGNLTKAIEIYNSLVNDNRVKRTLRAKALLHVGICYEKLGNQNAKRTYQKLIAEYSDQSAIVAMGKEKLKGLKNPNPIVKKEGIVASQIWSPAQDTYGVSPNGRYLNYIDWDNISLNLKDLHTGKSRVLSKVGTWKEPIQFPDNSIWSPDGKKLAYYWFENNTTELHIINVDGTNNKVMVTGTTKNQTPWPVRWSPNGKYILSILTDKTKDLKNGNHQIALFSVNDGSLKILKSFEEFQLGGQMDISPDNKYIVYAIQQMEGFQENDIYILSMDGKINKKIVSNSANDFNPRWTLDGKGILFISDRYGTNDLWKIKIENGINPGASELVKANLGNQTKMLGITKDKSVYYRVVNSRTDIHLLNVKKAVEGDKDAVKKISKLDETRNIDPTFSKDGRYVAYCRWQLFRDDVLGNRLLITIYDTKTGKSRNVDTPLYNSHRVWYRPELSPNGEKILIFGLTKKNLLGGVFTFDIKTGKTTAIKVEPNRTRHINGETGALHQFSNDGNAIYYLSSDKKTIRKIEIESKKESTVYTNAVPMRRFKISKDESKIVLGQLFDDRNNLYIGSTTGGTTKKLVSVDKGVLPEIIGWDATDKYIYFGAGKFRDIKSIMKVSVNGGEPKQIINLKEVFTNGEVVTLVNNYYGDNTMAIELDAGGGNSGEIWKLEGVFNEQ
jgi:Tol biopolymer transport system component